MKYIKIFENYDNQAELKKLLSHLISIIKNYEFREENYLDRGKWETQFYHISKNDIAGKYVFSIILSPRIFTNNFSRYPFIDLIIKGNNNDFAIFFKEYLKTLTGIKIIKDEILFSTVWRCEYNINNKDVNKVIKQITKENIDLQLNANKYNL